MDYLYDIKFDKMRRKSKIKYYNIIKKSKDSFPSFLSTKHFYKKRKTSINIVPQNNNTKKNKSPEYLSEKISTKKAEKKFPNSKHNSMLLTQPTHLILDRKKNNLFIDTKNASNNSKNTKKNTFLTLSDKIRLKSILKNFEYNQLTTNSLYNLEKKFPLNSVTETNYLFLFSDYKNKKFKSKKDVDYINKNINSKISKSSLLSLNMMKKFNNRTNKLLEVEKIEGTKYSNNVNEFRKQIINSYKDSVILKDIGKRKINYDNAMKLIEFNKEKRIKQAFELEKEFYKNKNYENQYTYESRQFPEEHKRRRSKKTTTRIRKKISQKINSLSPVNHRDKNKKLSIYTFNNLNIGKLKDAYNNTNTNVNNTNVNNTSNLFSKTQSSYINDNQRNNTFNRIISKSHQNSNKKKLSNNNALLNNNTCSNKNIINNNNFNNNIYLNYINSTKPNNNNNKYQSFNGPERELMDIKEDYQKYVKKVIKERSKQLADSLAGINSYFEYQPLVDMNSDMPHLNINTTNLKRVIKVNNIKKNLYSLDDDDLLTQNIKKLKDEIREAEIRYYTVDGNKKKYHLSFLKDEVKPQTINKLNHMKNPHFGVPC